MSLGNHVIQAMEKVTAIAAASHGAGTVNGSWLDVRKYEGDLLFALALGALTGANAVKVQDADDGSGTNAADVSGATHTHVANTAGSIAVPANSVRGYVRLVFTVTTGPALAGGVLFAHPKYTS